MEYYSIKEKNHILNIWKWINFIINDKIIFQIIQIQ